MKTLPARADAAPAPERSPQGAPATLAARAAPLFARCALAAGFLSAVADRFGVWGAPGAPGVAWGAWAPFVAYTAKLNLGAPPLLAQVLAIAATTAEVVLGFALLAGWRLRAVAFASAALLFAFALAMVASGSPKAALDYSVFSAAAAALLLGVTTATHASGKTA